MNNAVNRRSTIRRISMRTNTSIKKVAQDNNAETTKKEVRLPDPNTIIIKNLSSTDPSLGKAGVRYSYIDNKFKTLEETDHFLDILDIKESILHVKDNEAESQNSYHDKNKKNKDEAKNISSKMQMNEKEQDSIKSMRNHLTFCERSSETSHKVILQKEVETNKLNRENHDGIFHAWDLFDTYMCNYIQKSEEKRIQQEIKERGKATPAKKIVQYSESLTRPSLFKALKLIERQIMQIINRTRYNFYRGWKKYDDSQDSNKMLFPLLSFPQGHRIRNRSVTALCWNTKFEDLFAVGFGNYEFPKKKEEKGELDDKGDEMMESGYIYVFSIKNNHFPEIKYTTDSGILCLDFHPKDYNLLVAGMYDGSVCVFDISLSNQKTPILSCNIRNQKHMDPVWQVRWYTPFKEKNKDNQEKFVQTEEEYVFYSISSDGKVIRWSFYKNKNFLETEVIITLKYNEILQKDGNNPNLPEEKENSVATNVSMSDVGKDKKTEKQDEALAFANAGGMCFDFNKHPGFDHLFVLGTEEGRLYLCSTNHREHTISSFEGHTMGVYSVSWNPFHPKVFGSCSADWTIKIWHYKMYAPLIVYDMQSAIGDLAWSPWCSTIFAVVNSSGDIKFFDLNRARKTPLEPKRYGDIPINHIAFNKFEFVFITGNDKGKITLWKMAEFLRVTIDKKELEEKEKEKKANADKNTNLPTTKIQVPQNLQENVVKTRKAGIQKKQVMKDLKPEDEKKRIDDFLELLDITDI